MFDPDSLSRFSLLLPIILVTTLAGCGSNDSNRAGVVLDSSQTSGSNADTQTTATGTIPFTLIQSGDRLLKTSEPSAPFTTDLPEGVKAVSVNSPAVVNFTIRDSAGNVVTGLQGANFRFAIAKLIPGNRGLYGVAGTGEADRWVSYIYRTRSGSAITDGIQATFENGTDGTLAYDEVNKYYSYTLATDLKTATRPGETTLIWDDSAVHRVAIQLELQDSNGSRILFNPHLDFTFENNNAVPLMDSSRTHRVVDESVCNQCHTRLIAHGGRVETEYCVMCHNDGSIDVEFGSSLDFKVMIHKIHKGRSLQSEYKIAGYGGVIHEWSDVGYPQDLRNCNKCHDGVNPLTPQGDNWKLKPTQQACSSCHEDIDFNDHQGFDLISDQGVPDNSRCAGCHAGQSFINSAHFNQASQHTVNYKFNINSFNYDLASRMVTVNYSVTNPANGTAYNLTEGLETCLADVISGTTTADKCRDLEGAPFSRLSLIIGSLTVSGASAGIDEYTNHDSSIFAWQGDANGDGSYTAELSVPVDAVGTARFLTSGQAQERKIFDLTAYNYALQFNTVITDVNAATHGVDWLWDNRVRVPIANEYREFSVDGSVTHTRREVVSDDKCNTCHSKLGTASGSNSLANAFHRGERSSVVACPVCHTPNRASSTLMSDEPVEGGGVLEPLLPGTSVRMNQSYEFKNMIHSIHGGEKRVTPFMHQTDNLSGNTHFPAHPGNCNACHINQSFMAARGKLGSAVSAETELDQRHIFSPFASSCMGCHDSAAARQHMSEAGGASVGDFLQSQWLRGEVYERCAECHGPGGSKDVSRVHAIAD